MIRDFLLNFRRDAALGKINGFYLSFTREGNWMASVYRINKYLYPSSRFYFNVTDSSVNRIIHIIKKEK
ncbi:hypothetical protein LCGC14_1974260 [marine sediment metagenome]|uniref:Uncharacterized protein n=1 Tax=marine sediment metagenome TaxID=412755 RepID=A0A0F9FAS8_9ZZZZ